MFEDVEFDLEGTVLRGRIYWPEDAASPRPLVIVHSGFGSVAEGHRDDLAPFFTKRGLAALFYDHRGYGFSDGQPRQQIDPWRFGRDERDVISLVSQRDDIDASRIALWGISLGGMVSLFVAGTDRRVAAVTSIVPPISGRTARELFPAEQLAAVDDAIEADRLAQLQGAPLANLIVSGERVPGGPDVLFTDPSGIEFVKRYEGLESFRNEVTMSSMANVFEMEVGAYAERVSAPLFMVVASEDTVAPVADARDFYERARGVKRLQEYPGQHYGILLDRYLEITDLTAEWLAEQLAAVDTVAAQ